MTYSGGASLRYPGQMTATNPLRIPSGGARPARLIAETPGDSRASWNNLDRRYRSKLGARKWSATGVVPPRRLRAGVCIPAAAALAEEHHVIQPFDQDAWSKPYASLDARAALSVFTAARRLEPGAARDRDSATDAEEGTHPERGTMTFQTIVETWGSRSESPEAVGDGRRVGCRRFTLPACEGPHVSPAATTTYCVAVQLKVIGPLVTGAARWRATADRR
jgi:hypothetical protein